MTEVLTDVLLWAGAAAALAVLLIMAITPLLPDTRGRRPDAAGPGASRRQAVGSRG